MHPTVIKVNGAQAVHPESRSKSPIPIPPAIAPVFLPNMIANVNNGTFPKWIKPPFGANGRRIFMKAVNTYVSAIATAVMTRDFKLFVFFHFLHLVNLFQRSVLFFFIHNLLASPSVKVFPHQI